MDSADKKRSEDARARSAVYRNLSALFADAPSAEALAGLKQVAAASGDVFGEKGEGRLYHYLRDVSPCDDEALRRSVASEYAELFVGPRPPLAPPYESVYLGQPKRLFTDQTMEVKRFYRRCGLSVTKDKEWKVPDDHLSLELEFMARLAEREADGAEDAARADATRADQLAFLEEHLGRWISLFAERVSKAPCAGFYRAASLFAAEFVEQDREALREDLGQKSQSKAS